jgi:hypothetical protein
MSVFEYKCVCIGMYKNDAFCVQNEHSCIGLAETEEAGPGAWRARVLAGASTLSARIGPAGGARGYTPTTGTHPYGICTRYAIQTRCD